MTTDVQVTAAEIARLAGVGRAAVSNWRRRHGNFPVPVGGTATSPSFSLHEIERWLRENGKLAQVDPVDRLWHALDSLGSEYDLAGGLVLAGLMLHAVRAHPDQTDDAPTLRAALPEELRGLFPDEFGSDARRLLEAVRDVDTDDAADVVEQLYHRFVHATSRHVAVTPKPLAALMIELSGVTEGTLFDPACGTGSLLRSAVVSHPDVHVVGQELDDGLAHVALVRLWFACGAGSHPRVAVGDSLAADAWPDLQADAAVCNPPFGLRDWGSDELAYDARWEYGLPPRGESELAWAQHLLAHVRPGGRVVVLMPPAVASRRSGRRIRAELLRRGALRAVISLPAGAAAPPGIPLTLWVLRRPDANDELPPDVLFVDAAGGDARGGRMAWAEVADRVRCAWAAFESGADADRPAHSAVVPVIDLLDEDVDLTSARYVQPDAPVVRVDEVRNVRTTFDRVLTSLAGLMPAVGDAPASTTQAVVSVSQLIRSGGVSLFHHVGRVEVRHDGGVGTPVLSGRDIAAGTPPSGQVPPGTEGMWELCRGDVVVVAVSERIRTRVIEEDGALLGPGLYGLRPDPDVVDPWFLAGCLRASSNTRFAATLGTTIRPDVRRLEVPRLPLAEQQAYGVAFRRLATLESGLRAAERSGQDLIRLVTDGLASGTLRPGRDA